MKTILNKLLLIPLFFGSMLGFSQVRLEKEILISSKGLYYDGKKVDGNATTEDTGGNRYDFAFGPRITPLGDCVKEYEGFVFTTWFRGGKFDRHVMLSRYNTNTGVLKTIEFPHRHTGFQNKWYIGENHNFISVGICPIDGTIHLVYDLHAYSEDRPADGSLSDDYFRYSYSKKNAATVPDNEFTLQQFVNDPDGEYKHLKMRPHNGDDYKGLTYPHFFLNKQNELFMWIREGGHNNGALKFCKYDGNSWSGFTHFNTLNARKNPGVRFNWGLYGDMKFENGKLGIAFQKRSSDNNDRYLFQNGIYFAYSDDPEGKSQWKDHEGKGFNIPLLDAERIKIYEPGELLNTSGPNSLAIFSGFNWTITDRGDVHISHRINRPQRIYAHTYKKAGTNNFVTSTEFAGGDLYTYNNNIYIVGLENDRVFVEKAEGGTNNFTRVYEATSGKRFRFGNVLISKGKLYYYLMEIGSGNAQPLYLQIIDLDLEDSSKPVVELTSPKPEDVYELGTEIPLRAEASFSNGNVERVNFKVDGVFFKSISNPPYQWSFTPNAEGDYTISAVAETADQLRSSEDAARISVVKRTPYLNNPTPIPGIVEAENYDKGANTITYYDTDTDNRGGSYRLNEGVDVVQAGNGNAVGFTNNGEWMDYSVEVQESGEYDLGILYSSKSGGGALVLELNGEELVSSIDLPSTDDWNTYQVISQKVELTAGEHVIRVRIKNSGFNLDKLVFQKSIISSIDGNNTTHNIVVFPNPSKTGIFHLSKKADYELHTLLGDRISEGKSDLIDISNFPSGVYILQVQGQTVKISK